MHTKQDETTCRYEIDAVLAAASAMGVSSGAIVVAGSAGVGAVEIGPAAVVESAGAVVVEREGVEARAGGGAGAGADCSR